MAGQIVGADNGDMRIAGLMYRCFNVGKGQPSELFSRFDVESSARNVYSPVV